MTYRAKIEDYKTNNPLEDQFMELMRQKDPYFDHPEEISCQDYIDDYVDESNYDPYSGQDTFEVYYLDDFDAGCEYD